MLDIPNNYIASPMFIEVKYSKSQRNRIEAHHVPRINAIMAGVETVAGLPLSFRGI